MTIQIDKYIIGLRGELYNLSGELWWIFSRSSKTVYESEVCGLNGFIGSYEHNLDSKNRLFVPAKFREGLSNSFIIKAQPSKYPCIQCFREDDYNKFVEKELEGITDPIIRRKKLFANYAATSEVTVDSQGRIMIPQKTTEFAKLTKEAIIVGMGDYVEIWNPETFNEYYAYVNESYVGLEEASESEEKISLERKANGDYLPTP